MANEQTRVASMTYEKRALEIADGLAGYIGTPKRRDELAEDIVDALRAVERETWEEANRLLNTFSQETGWRGARRDRILSAFRLRAEAAEIERLDRQSPLVEVEG